MSVLLVLGDSITYGHWDRQGGWVQRLRVFLETRSIERENHFELNTTNYVVVYNLGIPGDTSQGLLRRFDHDVRPRIDADQETIIIFAIGINDSHVVTETGSHKVALETFSRNILSLLSRARKITDKVIFVGLTPVDESMYVSFWNNPATYRNEYVRQYNAEIEKICKDYEVEFIDVLESFLGSDSADLLEDGIHLNDKGHALLEQIVRTHLLKKGVI